MIMNQLNKANHLARLRAKKRELYQLLYLLDKYKHPLIHELNIDFYNGEIKKVEIRIKEKEKNLIVKILSMS
jgi:hypothetical protein